jgi:hypothetical protein
VRTVVLLAGVAVLGGCSTSRRACCPAPCPVSCVPPAPAVASAEPRVHGRGSAAIWSYLRSRYDADRDGRVAATEYPRDPATFARLDADDDRALTAADFRGPTRMDVYVATLVLERVAHDPREAKPEEVEAPGPRALDEATLRRAFERSDANRNGLVGEGELDRALATAQATPAEGVLDLPGGVRPFPSLVAAMDDDRSGRLGLAEVLAWGERRRAEALQAPTGPSGTPPARPEPPDVGAEAPDFDLATLDGRTTLSLSSFRGTKPVALVFGSLTCPPFRHAAPAIRRAFDRHGRDVQFLFVYVREAHAIDGRAPMPAEDQPIVEEPVEDADRVAAAARCTVALRLGFPTLVDGLDDAVNRAYAASPVRLYVIGRDGRVEYRSEPGPFGLDPPAFEAAVAAAVARR